MTSFPDFPATETFPPFSRCPIASDARDETQKTYFLLAEIHENMTFSHTPTIICKDPTNASFALKLDLDVRTEAGKKAFSEMKLKKGTTIVVRDAKRNGVREGKQGYIQVGVDGLEVIPVSLERLLAMSTDATIVVPKKEDGVGVELLRCCQGCATVKGMEELLKCKGCGTVWYCDKACQVKGWSELGHKSECKILKLVTRMDFGDRL